MDKKPNVMVRVERIRRAHNPNSDAASVYIESKNSKGEMQKVHYWVMEGDEIHVNLHRLLRNEEKVDKAIQKAQRKAQELKDDVDDILSEFVRSTLGED